MKWILFLTEWLSVHTKTHKILVQAHCSCSGTLWWSNTWIFTLLSSPISAKYGIHLSLASPDKLWKTSISVVPWSVISNGADLLFCTLPSNRETLFSPGPGLNRMMGGPESMQHLPNSRSMHTGSDGFGMDPRNEDMGRGYPADLPMNSSDRMMRAKGPESNNTLTTLLRCLVLVYKFLLWILTVI